MKKRFADEQIAFVLRQAELMYFEADVLPSEEEGARCLDAIGCQPIKMLLHREEEGL